MASISQDPKSKMWRIHFRYGGKLVQKSLKTTEQKEAETRKGRVEDTLQAIEQGWVAVPPNADLWQFLFSGGRVQKKPVAAGVFTLEQLLDKYEKDLPAGTMEPNSLNTRKLHFKHLKRILGKSRAVQMLTVDDMQGYVNKRMREKRRDGKPIQRQTIKKEMGALATVWDWAALRKLATGPPPLQKLRYEKEDEELLPFMTWDEIEQRVRQPGLTQDQIDELWDRLFLDTKQIEELLAYVKDHARFPFIYPMFAFIAHTGARRAEKKALQLLFKANRRLNKADSPEKTRRADLGTAAGRRGLHDASCLRRSIGRLEP